MSLTICLRDRTYKIGLVRTMWDWVIVPSMNPLWPSDTIWQYYSGPVLAQVLAWCRQTPSHNLNQCWLIIQGVCCIHLRAISPEMPTISIFLMNLTAAHHKGQWVKEITLTTAPPSGQWVKDITAIVRSIEIPVAAKCFIGYLISNGPCQYPIICHMG